MTFKDITSKLFWEFLNNIIIFSVEMKTVGNF